MKYILIPVLVLIGFPLYVNCQEWMPCWNIQLDDDTLFCNGAVRTIIQIIDCIRLLGLFQKKYTTTFKIMIKVTLFDLS